MSKTPATSTPPTNWWFSSDNRRGFSWDAVIGYDYRPSGMMGFTISTIYVYTVGGIVNIVGDEASKVYDLLKDQVGIKRL